MTRRARNILRSLAAIIGVLLLGFAFLVWRLSVEPIETTFFTPYIESGIDHYLPGTHAHIEHTVTSWNNVDHVISLHAQNISVLDNEANVIATIPDLDVHISAFGLLRRKLIPLGLTIEAPHFKFIRDASGALLFGDLSTENKPDPAEANGSVKDTLKPILDDLTHATHRGSLSVKDILLDVHDEKTQSDWSVHVPEINIDRSPQSLAGNALLTVTQKDQTATLQIQYHYDYDKAIHIMETTLSSITPSFFAGGHPGTLGLGALSILDLPLTGSVSLAVDTSLNIKTLGADIHGDAGNLVYPDFWDQPRSLKTLDLKATYDRDAPDVNLAKLAVDFDGPHLELDATITPSSVPEHDVNFQLTAQLDNWPMDQFTQLWPKTIITNPREWIVKSMSKGNFDHGEAVFKGGLSWNDIGNMTITEGGGKVIASNGRVNYLDGMPPVDGVSAKAVFDMDQMTVDLSGGGIGALRLMPFSILMTDFEKEVQNIYIPLKFSGPITDILKLIDVPRLGYAKAIGLTPDDVTGSAVSMVELRFPLLNAIEMKDIDIKAHSDMTNVTSSKLVNKIDITNGDIELNLDKAGLTAKGTAALNKIISQITWRENFHEEAGKPLREGSITATVNDDQWKQLNLDALKGTHGPVGVKIDITQPTKAITNINGKFDLTGAELHVDQLKWIKPSGMSAQLNVGTEIQDKKNIIVKSIDLTAPQVIIKGTAMLSPDGDLLGLDLNPFKVGRTDAALKYEKVDEEGGALRFTAEGEALDISGLKGGHEVAAKDPRPKEYHIHVAKLYTSDTGLITDAQGYAIRDPLGWRAISLRGLADGQVPLMMDLGTKDGQNFFAASCDNFGLALKGLGVTDTVTDGKVQISGQSAIGSPRIINGTVKISAFTVGNLPALVVLLNATSPFGIPNLLSGSMGFDRLRGKFRWEGDNIDLMETHVAGSAVGLDVEGRVDMNAGTANLNGVVAPFSMVNNILGAIPLLGDMLTGGNGGGVFAVAYTITGDLSNPKVSVNPASLLTPGFLRNIFFGGDDDSDATNNFPKIGSDLPAYPSMNTQGNFNQK